MITTTKTVITANNINTKIPMAEKIPALRRALDLLLRLLLLVEVLSFVGLHVGAGETDLEPLSPHESVFSSIGVHNIVMCI